MNIIADRSTFIDRPFGAPLDTILDIPVPLSVNRTRKVNYAAMSAVKNWKASADAMVMASGQYKTARRFRRPEKPCEIKIILCEKRCKLDPDNPIKNAIDYLRALELIENDTGKHVRKITVEWGAAPQGCRIIISEAA